MDTPWEDFQNQAPTAPIDQPSSAPWEDFQPKEEPRKLMSTFRGAANNIPLMPQAIAAGTSLVTGGERPYSENLEQWNQQAKEAKQANPKSYGVGAVGGALAPLAIPGIGEMGTAGNIATNAGLGVANALSNEDLTKNPTELGKKALTGGVIGGGVGAAGEAIGAGLNAAKSGLTPAANRIESNALAGGLDLNSHAIRRLAPGDVNPEVVMKKVGDKIQELFPDLIGYTDTAGSKLGKIIDAHEEASAMIGQVVDETTQKTGGVLPEANKAIESLEQNAAKFNGRTSSANLEAKNILTDTSKDLQDLQKSGQLTFKNLYEIKKGIGEAFHSSDVNKGSKIAYGIVSDTIDNILDRIHTPVSVMKQQFDHAKDVFRLTSDLIPAMKPGVAREVAGVGGGLTNAGLATAGVMGHPAAWPALAAKNVSKWMAPDLGKNIAYKGVNAIKNIPKSLPSTAKQGLTQEMIDYINSKVNKK